MSGMREPVQSGLIMDASTMLAGRGLVSPSPPEVARRVRAAFAYAGLDVSKPVAGLGIDPSTIQRMVDPIDPRGATSEHELRQIALATGVPAGFLLSGFMLESLLSGRADRAGGSGDDARRTPVADPSADVDRLWASLTSQFPATGDTDSPAARPGATAEATDPRIAARTMRRGRRRQPRWWRRRRRAWWE
jgi:hypothetical protein